MTDNSNEHHERRQSFRIDMEKELVDIVWVDAQGQQHQKMIACLDFSKGGLKLDCDHAIEINTEVTIIFKSAAPNNQSLPGRVIRCIEQDNGWFELAIRLDN